MTAKPTALPSSYRDPSGFVFEKDGVIYRQVNKSYKPDFDLLNQSGLYRTLVDKGLLLPHDEVDLDISSDPERYKILKPVQVPVLSYPYEWSFGMMKDAALLTMEIQRLALDAGMSLKDATPFNIQWFKGRMVFIDTLSFERYDSTQPWVAYRQFCECFLSPLLLMHYSQKPLQQLLTVYPDGIPLPVTSSLLPGRTRFSLHVYLHIHLHGRLQGKNKTAKKPAFSKQKMLNIVSSLEAITRKLRSPGGRTAWSNYYEEPHLSQAYLQKKQELVSAWTNNLGISIATDLGANDGRFSRLIAEKGVPTIASDIDERSIDRLYNEQKKQGDSLLQPIVADIVNPSPGIGLNNEERTPLLSRLSSDLVLALALIHHLVIGRNVPVPMAAELLKRVTRKYLLIEFVPRDDEKVQHMLSGRKDIFGEYDETHFEQAFSAHFHTLKKEKIAGSSRILYLMSVNEN